MTANVVVQGREPKGTALLPLTSIYRKDSDPAVWVYDPVSHKVSLRPVTVAQYREDGVLVASGLAAGEWVVAAGVHKLRDGEVVRPYEGAGAAAPGGARSADATEARRTASR